MREAVGRAEDRAARQPGSSHLERLANLVRVTHHFVIARESSHATVKPMAHNAAAGALRGKQILVLRRRGLAGVKLEKWWAVEWDDDEVIQLTRLPPIAEAVLLRKQDAQRHLCVKTFRAAPAPLLDKQRSAQEVRKLVDPQVSLRSSQPCRLLEGPAHRAFIGGARVRGVVEDAVVRVGRRVLHAAATRKPSSIHYPLDRR
eukprot:scaffold42176_cov71-Phaeocystis_antarctica.AAC.2